MEEVLGLGPVLENSHPNGHHQPRITDKEDSESFAVTRFKAEQKTIVVFSLHRRV